MSGRKLVSVRFSTWKNELTPISLLHATSGRQCEPKFPIGESDASLAIGDRNGDGPETGTQLVLASLDEA